MEAGKQYRSHGPGGTTGCVARSVLLRTVSVFTVGLAVLGLTLSCAQREEKFPNQIPDVKVAIGTFLRAISMRDSTVLDSICTDDRLFGDVLYVLGPDSLALLSRRIQNPIDSAHVTMTIAVRDSSGAVHDEPYSLELFMRKRGDQYWIVGHRLTRSPL